MKRKSALLSNAPVPRMDEVLAWGLRLPISRLMIGQSAVWERDGKGTAACAGHRGCPGEACHAPGDSCRTPSGGAPHGCRRRPGFAVAAGGASPFSPHLDDV